MPFQLATIRWSDDQNDGANDGNDNDGHMPAS